MILFPQFDEFPLVPFLQLAAQTIYLGATTSFIIASLGLLAPPPPPTAAAAATTTILVYTKTRGKQPEPEPGLFSSLACHS